MKKHFNPKTPNNVKLFLVLILVSLMIPLIVNAQSLVDSFLVTGGGYASCGDPSRNYCSGWLYTSKTYNMTTISLYLKKVNSPTYNISVRIYNVTSVSGVSPNINVTMCRTDYINSSTLTAGYAWYNFTFPGGCLVSGVQGKYFLTLVTNVTDASNTIDFSGGAANGNDTYYYIASWNTLSTNQMFNYQTFETVGLTTTMSFKSQSPTDIRSTSLFSQTLNITYNVTDALSSNISISYNITTYNNTCAVIANQTCLIPNSTYRSKIFDLNNTPLFSFYLYDNDAYPGLYNYPNQSYMSTTIKENFTVTNSNYFKVRFYNISNKTQYNIFEFMVKNSSATSNPLHIYYCNSSYTTGNVQINNNCANIANLLGSQVYNHSHSSYSNHSLISLPIVNNSVLNVKFTSLAYFVFTAGASVDSWYVYYLANQTDINTTMYSNNNGASYIDVVGTFDAHIHQFSNSDKICYRGQYNDSLGEINTSGTCDTYDLDAIPPSTVTFYSPQQIGYNGNVLVNYSAANDPISAISYYNVSVCYPNGTIVRNDQPNNSNSLTYTINIAGLADGNYSACVRAYNNVSASSFSISPQFRIDTIYPVINFTRPNELNTSTTNINMSYSLLIDFSDINLYAYEVNVIDPFGNLYNNYTLVDVPTSTQQFTAIFTPNNTGTWQILAIAADSHTEKKIEFYNYDLTTKKITFMFDKEVNYTYTTDNISIEYDSPYSPLTTEIKKLSDRYNFNYQFNLGSDKLKPYVTHKFRVKCADIKYLSNSIYPAHFICWNTGNWIDFNSKDLINYTLKRCGKDCYDLTMTTKPVEWLNFSSIGGLNIVNKTRLLNVVLPNATTGTNTTFIAGTCPDSVQGAFMYFISFIIVASIIYIALKFNFNLLGCLGCIGSFFIAGALMGCSLGLGVVLMGCGIMLLIYFFLN